MTGLPTRDPRPRNPRTPERGFSAPGAIRTHTIPTTTRGLSLAVPNQSPARTYAPHGRVAAGTSEEIANACPRSSRDKNSTPPKIPAH